MTFFALLRRRASVVWLATLALVVLGVASAAKLPSSIYPEVEFPRIVAGAADPRELRELAELVVRPALANVPGIGRIEVLGGDVREYEIILDPEATAALHLTPADVADRIRGSMGLRAVGRVDRDRQLV